MRLRGRLSVGGAIIAVLLLAALHVVANQLWLSWDEGLQYTDAAFHYSQVVERVDALAGGSAAIEAQRRDDERQRYGSFYYLAATGVALLAGSDAPALLAALSILLWPLLLFGAYRLGFELGPPRRRLLAGLTCAALTGLLPGLFNYSRVLVLDLPLAIAVCWATALLLGALRTTERRTRLWLGAGCALTIGLAIKLNALAFLIGPLWITASGPLRSLGRQDPHKSRRNVASVTALVALGGAWLLFGSRSDALIETALDSTWPGKLVGYARDGALPSYPGHYFEALRSHSWEVLYYSTLQSFTPPLLVVVLAATVWFFARRRGCQDPLARSQRDLVFWALIIPVIGVVLVLRDSYDERYLVPLLPLSAALVSTALWDIPQRWLRNAALAVLLSGAAVNFAVISFDVLPHLRPLACATVSGWAPDSRVGNRLWLCALYPDYQFMDRPSAPIGPEDGGPLGGQRGVATLKALDELLQPLRKELGRPLNATFLDDIYPLFYRSFDQSLRRSLRGSEIPPLFRQQDLLLLSKCTDRAWLVALFESLDGIEGTIADSDVVVMRYGSPNDPADTALRGRRCIVFWKQQRHWLRLRDLPLSDGTAVRVYRRRPDLTE